MDNLPPALYRGAMLRSSLAPMLASLLLLGCLFEQPPEDVQPKPSNPSPTPPSKSPTETADLDARRVGIEPIAPEGNHPFSVLDMLEVDRVSSPALSPDGSLVAYVLRETDMKANRGHNSLWLQPIAGGEPTQIDAHPKGASQPRWSPDGKVLYFVSSRAGTSQVFRRAITGTSAGPVEQVTTLPVPVANLLLSPDGKQLALSAELDPDCPDLACSVERAAAIEAAPATGVVYDRMFVRHWDSWKDHRRSMLLIVGSEPGGTPTIISKGLDADVPSKPFGGAEEWSFTPNGKGIVFTARDGGPGEPWSTNFDLYYAPIDGSSAPVRLTQSPAWDTHPRFSPDGKQLAYLAMARPGYEADRFVLTTLDWNGGGVEGEPRAVTAAWDRSIEHFEFGGTKLYATAQELGHKRLFALDLETGTATALVDTGTVGDISVGTEQLVFVRHDLRHPPELHTLALAEQSSATVLSHHNDALMARVALGEAEQFQFPGWKGETVHGWVVKPVDFDPDKSYPVAFLIHGGPQGSFGDQFHFRWNPQAYAGAGWATIMIDFHGSTGYGQAFTDSIGGDWGGKPLEDLQKGLAFALERYPWLDGDKVCALGASYGGFMINWIAGKWPDRFRCLVNHDGIFDQRMMYYATEELWFPEWEHRAPEFTDPAAYAQFNPVDHVNQWRTPMMVVHGSLDYRVPVEQGLATFTALQRRGIESRFLHFPDENHWVLSPGNVKQWHDEVLRWLESHR
jgi:dipeptidyl aminopeptidase/acylaminoacyl peptidase